MIKYVAYLFGNGYEGSLMDAICVAEDTYVYKRPSSSLVEKLLRTHFSWQINSRVSLPLKRLWYRHLFDFNAHECADEMVFILFEPFPPSFSIEYLKYLRQTKPKAKLCFYCTNPITPFRYKKLMDMKEYYDAIITFLPEDAKKYGLLVYEQGLYQPKLLQRTEQESDVFFIGSNKGRIKKLLAIYEKLTSLGLKCDFYITGVPKSEQEYAQDICYNQVLSYDDVIKHVMRSSCVLEVLQEDKEYASIRTFEAMTYKKKLLTTNSGIVKQSYYDSRLIQVIDHDLSFDVEFLKNAVSDELFPSPESFSFRAFKEFLKANVN